MKGMDERGITYPSPIAFLLHPTTRSDTGILLKGAAHVKRMTYSRSIGRRNSMPNSKTTISDYCSRRIADLDAKRHEAHACRCIVANGGEDVIHMEISPCIAMHRTVTTGNDCNRVEY